MKGKVIPTILTGVLVLAVIVYMAFYVVSAFSSPLGTAEAVLASAEETLAISGWFARDEVQIYGNTSSGISQTVIAEGAKVARYEDLIVTYANGATLGTKRELELVEERIGQLEAIGQSGANSDINKVDARLSDSLYALSYESSDGGVGGVSSYTSALKSLVLQRDYISGKYSVSELGSAISSLKTQRDVLKSQMSGGSVAVTAPVSGYFSSVSDGYEEALNIKTAEKLTVSEILALSEKKQPVSENCVGKICTSFGWRYVAVLPELEARLLNAGTYYTMRFTGDYIGQTRVRLLRVGDLEEGKCVVVFSCSMLMSDLLHMRRQSAEIVLESFEGVRVPKTAVRVDEDGNVGVYCLVAMQAKFVKVEQIYEFENYYIVSYNPQSSAALRPGDEIIISSKNLHDGKIVR